MRPLVKLGDAFLVLTATSASITHLRTGTKSSGNSRSRFRLTTDCEPLLMYNPGPSIAAKRINLSRKLIDMS